VGRADRPAAPAHRLPQEISDRGGNHHRSVHEALPHGERYVAKAYPKDNEPRTFGVDEDWLEAVAQHIKTLGIGRDQLLFTTSTGTPISRNTFRTRVWRPAVTASGVEFAVRMHDLRHAHASWLLAEGSDLRSVMERMGNAQIQTTQKYLARAPRSRREEPDVLARARRRRQQPD
jgi:integrase